MGKNLYVGIDGKARKAKKIYVGIDEKARKVKKAWIGVNGIARLFYSSEGILSYYGTTTNLNRACKGPAGASIGNYAIFAGGADSQGNSSYNTATAYNSSLVKYTPASLSVPRENIGTASIGNYAIFAGGFYMGKGAQTTVDAYDTSLT